VSDRPIAHHQAHQVEGARMTVFQASGITVSYGGVRALSDVDIEVDHGQLIGLIGPNGAGKTTFVDAVSGFIPCRGSVQLEGRDISRLGPRSRARTGLARTFQAAELFDDLTVRENLEAAAVRLSAWQAVRELLTGRPTPAPRSDSVIERLGLEAFVDVTPDELTPAQRKLVGVGRAIAADPHIVCLDEPAAGLNTAESAALGLRLRALVDDGQAMLLIDHDMDLVLSTCDHIVVLDFGHVIASGPPDRIREDERVIEAYLGSGTGGAAA
jgi:branched-chain amino acid transport system ATP-binding protein